MRVNWIYRLRQFIAVEPMVVTSRATYNFRRDCCFELLGFDVLIDDEVAHGI